MSRIDELRKKWGLLVVYIWDGKVNKSLDKVPNFIKAVLAHPFLAYVFSRPFGGGEGGGDVSHKKIVFIVFSIIFEMCVCVWVGGGPEGCRRFCVQMCT